MNQPRVLPPVRPAVSAKGEASVPADSPVSVQILAPVSGLAPPPSARPASQLRLLPLPEDDPLYATAQAAAVYMKQSKADATNRAYASDWRHFVQWCTENGLPSLPATPSTVALYITSLAKPREGEKPRKAATITRRLTSINVAHQKAKLDSPATMNHNLVADTLHGIRRNLTTAQTRKKPLTRNCLIKLLDVLEGPVTAARDKALLLVGFAGGLRRSELAALELKNLQWHRQGVTLHIVRSKTDQEGEGREVELPLGAHDLTCPVMALENWIRISGIKDGFLLRRVGQHGNVGAALDKDSIGRIVKKLVKRAKLANPDAYGGHSLRAGFVTEAAANGATDREIMKQTGHKSILMVHRYARADQKDRQAAASKLGL